VRWKLYLLDMVASAHRELFVPVIYTPHASRKHHTEESKPGSWLQLNAVACTIIVIPFTIGK